MAEISDQAHHFRVLIIGGGAGGISVAARLARTKGFVDRIGIVEPSAIHVYQPSWTLAGAGLVRRESSARAQRRVIPDGTRWIQGEVAQIIPREKAVVLSDGRKLTYDFLVVACGLRLAWEKIEGAREALGKDGVCSIYQYDQIEKAREMITTFRGGLAVFTMPPVPIKCAGAPQKIMYLADDLFRRAGVREKSVVQFATAGKAMFGVPIFSKALDEVIARRQIIPLYQHNLIAIDGAAKIATFRVTSGEGVTEDRTLPYDLLHVVPPMSAPAFIAESELAATIPDQQGWLAVDSFSLQHLRYAEIFGIGDITGIPNSKTAAAVRKQAPIVVENLLALAAGAPLTARYDGYSSCPLTTAIGKVMLAEFGYDGKLMPTFPLDPTVERRSMWILKKNLLPTLYWQGMLKGRA